MTFLLLVLVIVGSLIFGGLQKKYSPGTMINGFMDYEKAKEIYPEIFDSEKKKKKSS